jgi:hypothetical protein
VTQGERTACGPSLSHGASVWADTLVAGEVLMAGQQLDAPTQAFSALMRGDGNFVVYRNDDWSKLWSSGTDGHPEASVVMQDDGDLVIYASDGKRLWSTATGGNPGAFVQLHDDGQLVTYGFYRDPLWSSESTP